MWISPLPPQSQIDDGRNSQRPPNQSNIDIIFNGEPIENTDVVVWYGQLLHLTT